MNSTYGNRHGFSITPSLRWGAHVARDARVLASTHQGALIRHLLLWTIPWPGLKNDIIDPQRLRPWPLYIEICRRIRLFDPESAPGHIQAAVGTSKSRRIDAKDLKGLLDDPWTLQQKNKATAITEAGFRPHTLAKFLNPAVNRLPLLARHHPGADGDAPMYIVARALARGQGKTKGYHSLTLPVANETARMFDNGVLQERLAETAEARVAIIAAVHDILGAALRSFTQLPAPNHLQVDQIPRGPGRRNVLARPGGRTSLRKPPGDPRPLGPRQAHAHRPERSGPGPPLPRDHPPHPLPVPGHLPVHLPRHAPHLGQDPPAPGRPREPGPSARPGPRRRRKRKPGGRPMTTGEQETQPQHEETALPNRYDPTIAGPIALRLLERDIYAGDLADLRRMDPLQPLSQLFWNLMFRYRITDRNNPAGDDVQIEQAWAHLVNAVAHGTRAGTTGHTGPHNPALPLGSALAEAGYHEARMNALLSANPDQVRRLALQAAQFLHPHAQTYNCVDLARLMLTPLRSRAQRDADRTYMARNYHRTLYNMQQH